MGEIGVRSYMKGDYEEFYALKASKKQSQSKPNGSLRPEIRNTKL